MRFVYFEIVRWISIFFHLTFCHLLFQLELLTFTSQNSIHPTERNSDVLSDRRESLGGSSMSVEFLFSACGGWGSTKF